MSCREKFKFNPSVQDWLVHMEHQAVGDIFRRGCIICKIPDKTNPEWVLFAQKHGYIKDRKKSATQKNLPGQNLSRQDIKDRVWSSAIQTEAGRRDSTTQVDGVEREVSRIDKVDAKDTDTDMDKKV
jgi:hypothetical protein